MPAWPAILPREAWGALRAGQEWFWAPHSWLRGSLRPSWAWLPFLSLQVSLSPTVPRDP